MRQARTKWAVLLAVLLVAAFGALALANGIQHNHSRIKITEGVIDAWRQDEPLGSLPYKFYTPLTATAEHKAPGVLLVASLAAWIITGSSSIL